MKYLKKSVFIKFLVAAAAFFAVTIVAGCASDFAEPFDFNNLIFDYVTVGDNEEKYIVITRHLVSQTDVRIPDAIYGIPVREIEDSVFAGDSKTKTVSLGKNVIRLGNNSFGNCPNLESVTFNSALTQVGEYAFRDCVSLPSVSLPDTVTAIGRGAFYGCRSLNEIVIPEGISRVGGRAFYGTAWLNAQSDNTYVTVGDGILIAYNGSKTDVKLPKSIRQIAGAFAGNTSVATVNLNEGVTSIGDMAFMGCTSLKAVRMPTSLNDIGADAFHGCTAISQIILAENVLSIGSDAFADCSARLLVRKDSYAESYCKENGLDCYTMK